MASPDEPARALLGQDIAEADTKNQQGKSADTNVESTIDLFDVAEIRRQIGDDQDDFGMEIGHHEPQALSNEEVERQRRLRARFLEPENPARRLLIADEVMLARIDAIRSESPHFSDVISLVQRAARLSLVTQSPLAIPPLLLLGEPGIGKSASLHDLWPRRLARIASESPWIC